MLSHGAHCKLHAMGKFKRVFHHHDKWEDAAAGMWRRNTSGEERVRLALEAASVMRNPGIFYEAMAKVTREWPYSCEANLTAPTVNRRAWLGHAGCCILVGSPEDVTRQAWWTLTQTEQDAANAAADRAIAEWETRYVQRLKEAERA